MLPRVLTLQMDYHKCLRTPKVSSQDGFYARKLQTNLFGIYCANEDIIHCFFYDESIGGTSPNEVISFLNYLLKSFQEKHGKFHYLILWAVNLPAQFKECYLFFYLDYLVRKGEFLWVHLKFLLEGHSFQFVTDGLAVFSNSSTPKKKLKLPRSGKRPYETVA